jgi:hypothetical protein
MADAKLPRTMVAQRERPYDWIGTYAGEKLGLMLEDAEALGVLRSEAVEILRFCLPALEQQVERTCLAGMFLRQGGGLDTPYGFPRCPHYPVIVSALRATGDPARPLVAETMGGIIEHWLRSSESVARQDWFPVIAAMRGGWPAVSFALTAKFAAAHMAETIVEEFAARTQQTPAEQLVLLTVAAGDQSYLRGFCGLVGLPGLEAPADAIAGVA